MQESESDTHADILQKAKILRKCILKKEASKNSLRNKLYRNKKKITKMSDLLQELLQKKLISEETHDALQASCTSSQDELSDFLTGNKSNSRTFPPAVRRFALNLNFYSPKAYAYVRGVFKNRLPHQRTIRKWLQNTNFQPGFTSESFSALQKAVDEARSKGQKLICNLIFDEIAIRERVEWDGNRWYGYEDFGNGCESDVKATQVLVFMLVCLNRSWKLPLGYFPIHSISAEQKKNLLIHCIQNVTEAGAEISGVTFDGAANNVTLARLLGAEFDISKSEFCFTIGDNQTKIPLFLDVCHMIKLIRNTFAELSPLVDANGHQIDWKYLVELQKLQEMEGLHLGNKVRRAHIFFQKQKMKVRLATQLLSKSVADALDYCRVELQLPEFAGSEATARFIRALNDTFDILNSRRINDFGLKQALSKDNIEKIRETVDRNCAYIASLKFLDGNLIVQQRRKLGFVGLIVGLRNLEVIYDRFVASEILVYIPTYKLNQDHVELFFSSIRSRLGYNNNPTVRQFKAAYRQLVVHCQIREGGVGNCLPLESIEILNCSPLDAINNSTERAVMVDESPDDSDSFKEYSFLQEHDYLLNPSSLNIYCKKIVEYIAGFIVFRLQKSLRCSDCIAVLQGNANASSLITYKSLGFLKNPSKSVITICESAERELRKVTLIEDKNVQSSSKTNFLAIGVQVQKALIDRNLFEDCSDHMSQSGHYGPLVKLIIDKYLNVRFHYIAKTQSEKDSDRNHLTRLILFRNM